MPALASGAELERPYYKGAERVAADREWQGINNLPHWQPGMYHPGNFPAVLVQKILKRSRHLPSVRRPGLSWEEKVREDQTHLGRGG